MFELNELREQANDWPLEKDRGEDQMKIDVRKATIAASTACDLP